MQRRITSCHHHTQRAVAGLGDAFDGAVDAAKRNATHTPNRHTDFSAVERIAATRPIGTAPNPAPL